MLDRGAQRTSASTNDDPSGSAGSRDRRSGQSRSTVVLYMANGENMVVIGSNAGNEGPPAWALNLLANPEAKGTSLVLFDTEENAEAASQALRVGSSPAPWVTVTRREVREVAASA
jgi:hypothetical protein